MFGLDEFQRGLVAALAEPAQIVAILLGIPLASRLMLRDPGSGLRMLAVVGIVIARRVDRVRARARGSGSRSRCTSSSPALAALLVPGIYAALSLAIPPKVRSHGLRDGRRCSSLPGLARAVHRRRHRRHATASAPAS